jgi:hypothetical protein
MKEYFYDVDFLYENSSDTALSLKNTDIKFYQNVSSGA